MLSRLRPNTLPKVPYAFWANRGRFLCKQLLATRLKPTRTSDSLVELLRQMNLRAFVSALFEKLR